jgi:hypothetical protein
MVVADGQITLFGGDGDDSLEVASGMLSPYTAAPVMTADAAERPIK